MSKERWRIPESAWEKADVESLKFIYEQAEKYFSALERINSNITNRSYTFLAILISFVSIFASLMYSSDNGFKDLPTWKYLWIIPIILSFVILIYNIIPYKMMLNGYIPKHIEYNEFFNDSIGSLSLNALLLDQIEDIQQKIDFYKKVNSWRKNRLVTAIILTSVAILFLTIVLFI